MKKVAVILIAVLFISSPGFTQPLGEKEDFSIAQKAYADGFYDSALNLFSDFINNYKQSEYIPSAKFYIGKIYYQKKYYAKALKVLRELVNQSQVKEFYPQIYFYLADILFKGKDYKGARDYINIISQKYRHSLYFWYSRQLLAQICLKEGKYDLAKNILSSLIDTVTDEKIAQDTVFQLLDLNLRLKDYLGNFDIIRKYLKKYPAGKKQSRIYFYLAETYYGLNDYKNAVKNYLRAEKLNKSDSPADYIYQGLVWSYLNLGKYKKAQAVIGKIKNKELSLFSFTLYYFKTKNNVKALNYAKKFISQYPKSRFLPQVYLTKADSLYQTGRIKDAAFVYKRIIKSYAQTLYSDITDKAHYGLAWCYLKEGDFKSAVREFQNTLKYSNDETVKISSKIQMADTYQQMKKYAEALFIYEDLLKKYPVSIYADYIQFQIGATFLRMGSIDKALLAFRNLENNWPHSKLVPQAQYYLAVAYFSENNYVYAENIIRDFIDKFPKNPLVKDAYYLYAKSEFNQKRYGKAIELFDEIINNFKDTDLAQKAYLDKALCFLNQDDFASAKQVYSQFLNLFPKSSYAPAVCIYLAGVLEKQNDYAQAQIYYKKIISDYPLSRFRDEALYSLASIELSRGNFSASQRYLSLINKKDKVYRKKSLFIQADIFQHKKEQDKALAIYQQLIGGEDEFAKIALIKAAQIYQEEGNYSEAAALIKKAQQAGVDSSSLRFRLGYCLEKAGQLKAAVKEYFNALYLFKDSGSKKYQVKVYFRIAKIYEKLEQFSEAEKIYAKISALDIPESKIALERLKEIKNLKP